MSASPLTPPDLDPISASLSNCDYLKELFNIRAKLRTFIAWVLKDDSSGELGTGFKEALVQQMLFDASKKGYPVRSNPATGYLELTQYLPIAVLDPAGAADGDTISFDSGTGLWIISPSDSAYLAPTSGGVTVPDPDVGAICSVAHGLGAVPEEVECYLECNSTDAGYAVGDKVNALSLMQEGAGAGETRSAVTVGADATLMWVVFLKAGTGPNRMYNVGNKSSFAATTISPAKWNIKLRAKL